MPEICNDANTVCLVEDSRATFEVQTGGRSGTPTLEIQVINGNMLEVSCQFIAKTPVIARDPWHNTSFITSFGASLYTR